MTPAEAGDTKTHEKYVRLPNNFDYQSFFQQEGITNGSVIQVDFDAAYNGDQNDVIPLKFVYYASSNQEKRIPSLGPIFDKYNVTSSDVVYLESRTENGRTSFSISFKKDSELRIFTSPIVYEIEDVEDDKQKQAIALNDAITNQIIYYGAPGTGKSHKIKEKLAGVSKENIFRTTFHPDSDYSTFVGAYKPSTEKPEEKLYNKEELISKLTELKEQGVTYAPQKFGAQYWYSLKQLTLQDKKDILTACEMSDIYTVEFDKGIAVGEELLKKSKESRIIYKFIPQAFLLAYMRAYSTTDKVYLIIEEINRGNCAQIFGDLFQLLDRDENGVSEYHIKADTDLRAYLEEELGADSDAIKDGELCLPSNLYIYATMNTSDQSLFPIDSAFKRRWDWEYEPIKYKNTNWVIDINGNKFSWVSFQREVNKRIFDATNSEDKMLGDYFVNSADGVITEKILLNKILFYLWNDVCKDGEGDIFKTADNEDVIFSDLHSDGGKDKLIAMMKYLKVQNMKDDENDEGDDKGSDGTYTKRHLKVVFPDGITYEENNSTDTLISTINKIGPDKVYQLNMKISDYPFISKEKLSDDGRGYGNSQRELKGGYYVITKLATDAKLDKIQEISQRLNCDLSVSIIEL